MLSTPPPTPVNSADQRPHNPLFDEPPPAIAIARDRIRQLRNTLGNLYRTHEAAQRQAVPLLESCEASAECQEAARAENFDLTAARAYLDKATKFHTEALS
jgi:hypothetical protein